MESTAIYPNRIEDKEKIESQLHIPEYGSQINLYIRGHIIAEGYERIVYGDHGPYIEFTKQQLKCDLKSKFHTYIPKLPEESESKYYYHWLYPSFDKNVKIYWQIKPVIYLKNAPARDDGKPSQFNRAEGYADYRRGYYYIDAFIFDPIKKEEK